MFQPYSLGAAPCSLFPASSLGAEFWMTLLWLSPPKPAPELLTCPVPRQDLLWDLHMTRHMSTQRSQPCLHMISDRQSLLEQSSHLPSIPQVQPFTLAHSPQLSSSLCVITWELYPGRQQPSGKWWLEGLCWLLRLKKQVATCKPSNAGIGQRQHYKIKRCCP